MLRYAQYSFVMLLFMLIFFFIRHLLLMAIRQRKARFRLQYVQDAKLSNRLSSFLARYNVLYRHVSELIESTGSQMKVSTMFTITLLLILTGIFVGALFFQSVKGVLVLTFIFASLPYTILRLRLIGIQLKTRLEFLPAVEIFYQYYMICGQKNAKIALKTCLEEERLLYPMKPIFEQLYRNLMTNRNVEDCLRVFSLTLGHVWADYFVSILRVALIEGNQVSDNVKDLITDMRKAQRHDQAERNRLLEIRIANFSPIFFLALFLFVNFKINYENSYLYYVLDPTGRNMLLDAILLIFISFMMGIYLSMRRM